MGIDGGHWYLQTGKPYYETPDRSGRMRAVTLRDARLRKAVPSVTTVTSLVSSPGLQRWKDEQLLLAALTYPFKGGESHEEKLAILREDAQKEADMAAAKGSAIHDAIEHYMVTGAYSGPYLGQVRAAMVELVKACPGVNDWITESSFAHPLGYGGRIDLYSPSTGIVVDWKTKDGDMQDGKRLAYNQNWQLGAYQMGKHLKLEQCVNIFISRDIPDNASAFVWSREEVLEGQETFRAILEVWKRVKKYDPSWVATA